MTIHIAQPTASRGENEFGRIMARNRRLRNGLALVLAIAVGSCAAPSTGTGKSAAAKPTATVPELLELARTSLAGERARYLLDATDLLLQQNKPEQAEAWLQTLGSMTLSPAQRGRYRELSARLQMQQGKPRAALALLQDPQLLQDMDQLPVAEQISISLLRAKALALTGDHLASAQERVFVAPLLDDKQRAQNQKDIWRALMYLDAADLQNARAKAVNEQLRGWLELALIAKTNPGGIDAQAAQIAQWSRTWAGHPAAANLPGDLSLLREVATTQPKQVALLLPLSGKLAAFGRAVRDGFMAAWYDARARGGNPPALRIYDTETEANFFELYQRAVADGAELIVGPLEKNQVAALYQQVLPVPTLALNRTDIAAIAPTNLYQFSLAPEDEAVQIADIAVQENHRRALVIAPSEDARSRELQVFSERLRQRGGEVVATALYSSQQNLSQEIKTALNIPRSEARAKELERVLNRNIEFTPQRRQDVDMVFMLAKTQQARSIKPMLAYYYAGDLPVYALSRIYNGYPTPEMDRDLENVRFTEMPWILDQQNPLKQQILASQPGSHNYLRLYALGVDSFHLYPRLRQMEKSTDHRMPGQTGYLTVTPQLIVQRELLLAQMRNGRPEAVPTAMLREDAPITATESPIDANTVPQQPLQ